MMPPDRVPPAFPRWLAAVICFVYGFAKINGAQFTVLDSELARPLGEVSGFWLTWHYFGFSPVYGALLAGVQIIAGILLVIPRTALAGAVLLLPVTVNIVAIDLFYGVDLGGTLAALVLLVCVSAVLAPFGPRLRAAILLNATPARPAVGTLVALAVVLAGACAFTWWIANYNNRAPTSIDGVWSVSSQAGPVPETTPWQQVFFERNRAHLVVFRAKGRSDERHHFEIDTQGVVRIWETWLTKGALLMEGQARPADRIELTIGQGQGAGRLVLKRETTR